jgi:hypothetical protein
MRARGDSRPAAGWIALVLVLAFSAIVIGASWARWGNIRIDSGGAIQRAAQIAQGAVLYRDIEVHYPPLAPNVVGALFATFGIHLNTVYGLGLLMTALEALLLWSVARRVLSLWESTAGLIGFLGLLAFQPFLFNWVVPNVFASTFGTLFATATVAVLAADAERPRRWKIPLASILAALAGLGKLEHGLAAVCALSTYAIFLDRSGVRLWRRLGRAWGPGALTALLAAAVQARFVPLEHVLLENLFRQRSLGTALASYTQNILPSRQTVLHGAALDYLLLVARVIFAAAGFALLAHRPTKGIAGFSQGASRAAPLVCGLALLGFSLAYPWLPVPKPALSRDLMINSFKQFQFAWTPVAWLVALGWSAWKLPRDRSHVPVVVALVAVYSLASTARWSLHVCWPAYYAVFAPFLAVAMVSTLARPLAGRWTAPATAAVMTLWAVQGTWNMHTLHYRAMNAALDYPRGQIYGRASSIEQMGRVVDYLRANTDPGDPVAVLPEEQLINFLAETRHPTRDTGVGPGRLATPADERRFFRELEEAETKFIVVSKRRYREFNAGGLAGYNPRVMSYVRFNYELVLDTGFYRIFRSRVLRPEAVPQDLSRRIPEPAASG